MHAGDFDEWLQDVLKSFRQGTAIDVPCGECRGCCRAGRFVHLSPSDRAALSSIPGPIVHRAPGMPDGHFVMGYLDGGACPMLKAGVCSIYPSRPSTCRTFDCRILAATGLFMDGKWSERINERVRAWQFTFRTEDGRLRHRAMQDAASFVQQHGAAFPNGQVPVEPSTIAVLAIKVHAVFLAPARHAGPAAVAAAVVDECRRFGG